MVITRQEIEWMLTFVKQSRNNSKALKDFPGQKFAALHVLEYKNMSALADKLERILNTGAERVDIH